MLLNVKQMEVFMTAAELQSVCMLGKLIKCFKNKNPQRKELI